MKVNLRREPRNRTDGVYSICWQAADGVVHSAQAQGRDRSPGGVGLLCSTALPPDATVTVEGPVGAPSGQATVRHCTPSGGAHFLGLELSVEARTGASSGSTEPDYYEFLQINPKSGEEVIHRIYRFMASRNHPDNPTTGDLENFLLLNRAYEVLSDSQRRADYDAFRANRETTPDRV